MADKDKDKDKPLTKREYLNLSRRERQAYDKKQDKLLKGRYDVENKLQNTLEGIDLHFNNFGQGLKDHLSNMRGSEDALAQFIKVREDSTIKLGKDLEKGMRGTLSLVERFAFDTQKAATDAIIDANLAVKDQKDMTSQVGIDLEKQYMGLLVSLQEARDNDERKMLIQQIAETKRQGITALKGQDENLKRFTELTGKAADNIETLDDGMSIWKGALADSVMSYEDMASKMLGGGFLGKLAVNLIKRKKQQKQIELATQARIAQSSNADNELEKEGLQNALRPAEVAGGTPSEIAMIAEVKTTNKHLSAISGIQSDLFEVAEGSKEERQEEYATDERRHDESLAATGKISKVSKMWGKMKGGGSAIWDVIVGLIGGKWISVAAGFLLSPIKKLVGAVAGGIGKAIGFIMPKKWTSGLANFFKGTDKLQAGAVAKTKKSGGFLKKIIDGFKQIFKGIGDLIVGIFKTLSKVMKHIGKGIADLLKGIAKGVGHFGKPQVLLGALALVVVAGGIWVFSKAMIEFTKVTWKAVGVAVVSMIALVGALALIGALMMSGIGAVALLAGAAALVVVAGAMWVLGKGLQEIGKSIPLFTPLIDKFSELGMVGLKLIGAAAGILAVAGALGVFMAVGAIGGIGSAAAGVVTGILDWFSGKDTKSPLQILGGITAFAQEAGSLDKGAKGIYLLVNALKDFSKVKLDNKQIEETIHMIAGLAGVLGAFVSGQPSVLGGIGKIFGGPIELAGTMFSKLLGIGGTEKTPLEDYTDQFVRFINAIPVQKINEKAKAIRELATAIGDVSNNLNEIRGGVNIGDVLSRNQDANIILNNLAAQAAAQVLPQINAPVVNNVSNNQQNIMLPMNVRNSENSLNEIQNRRW
jgi:hypothetical protein